MSLKSKFQNLKRVLNLDVPPGHFYSPINDLESLEANQNKIWKSNVGLGASINTVPLTDQFKFIESKKDLYHSVPFVKTKSADKRYYLENSAFSYFDAYTYYFMLTTYEPKTIIEIGCGFSSALSLDYAEKNGVSTTFIEPYPEVFKDLNKNLSNPDSFIEDKIQNVSLDVFSGLEERDILFVDTSHISKTNSDVNHIIFNILPRISPGVIIHFHDIFFPFEYPKNWILKHHRSWNEAYLLRAFLSHNDMYKILFFNDWVQNEYGDWFQEHMPNMMLNRGGSIWLVKG